MKRMLGWMAALLCAFQLTGCVQGVKPQMPESDQKPTAENQEEGTLDKSKRAILDNFLKAMEDEDNREAQIQALVSIGKMSAEVSRDLGKAVMEVLTDESNSLRVRQAALEILEKWDLEQYREEIDTWREKLKEKLS